MFMNIFLDAPQSPPSTNPLQDSGWVGVGVTILSIVATVAVTIWQVRKQRIRKEVTYQYLEDLSILSFNERMKGIAERVEERLNITFDKRRVDDLRIFSLKVWNSGDLDVEIWNSTDATATDRNFEKPIGFQFLGRQIVSGIVETNPKTNVIEPEDLRAYTERYLMPEPIKNNPFNSIVIRLAPALAKIGTVHPTSTERSVSDFVELPHCLLKPSQSIILRLLLIGPKGDVNFRGKLKEWNIIEFDPAHQPVRLSIIWVALYLFMVSIFGASGLLFLFYPNVIQAWEMQSIKTFLSPPWTTAYGVIFLVLMFLLLAFNILLFIPFIRRRGLRFSLW